MILHEIDSESTWIETMKNKTKGETILSQNCALKRTKAQGIVHTHQVLDNEISTAYRLEIKQTRMTYQIFPPYDHQRNLPAKSIQT